MNTNGIKKELYKTKPTATFHMIGKGVVTYRAEMASGTIYFEVPFNDMGEMYFKLNMPAHLLIRWLK